MYTRPGSQETAHPTAGKALWDVLLKGLNVWRGASQVCKLMNRRVEDPSSGTVPPGVPSQGLCLPSAFLPWSRQRHPSLVLTLNGHLPLIRDASSCFSRTPGAWWASQGRVLWPNDRGKL